MEDKLAVITDKLSKRETERQSEIQRRNEEKDSSKSIQENVKHFNDIFSKEKSTVENELEESRPENKATMISKLDLLSKQVLKLQKYLTESTLFLPAYEMRQGQETIGNLQLKIQEKREELIPKKKFAFKSKKKAEQSITEPVSLSNGNSDKKPDNTLQVDLADCKFVDFLDTSLMKTDNDIFQKDVSLARLTNCTIRLFGAPSTVHIKNLKNCRVLCGPVSSSVFVSDCQNCVFVIACQQLRTHSTVHSKFYLHVTSRAIIEDCSDIYFAPYNLQYDNQDEHYKESGLDKTKNNWHDVDDFNWLASDAHSPNWSILPAEERILKFD